MTFALNPVRAHRSGSACVPKAPSIRAYFDVWAQRRELANLDHSRLIDLGISPAQAAREAARPFWDLP